MNENSKDFRHALWIRTSAVYVNSNIALENLCLSRTFLLFYHYHLITTEFLDILGIFELEATLDSLMDTFITLSHEVALPLLLNCKIKISSNPSALPLAVNCNLISCKGFARVFFIVLTRRKEPDGSFDAESMSGKTIQEEDDEGKRRNFIPLVKQLRVSTI